MRILSLLPAATEICFDLGIGGSVVGVTDDCDYPEAVKKLPKVTTCQAPNFLSSRQINDKVTQYHRVGYGISHLDWEMVEKLKPDLFLTQDLCDVCAVGYTEVKRGVRILKTNTTPTIVSLEPESISDIFENIKTIGQVTGKQSASQKLVTSLKRRLSKITFTNKRLIRKRVLIIEWLDPLMVTGHWGPQMVDMASGINCVTKVGDKSRTINIDQIAVEEPDVVVFAPCGFSIARTLEEETLIKKIKNDISNLQPNCQFFLMDGNQYLTRPGPRVVEGVEILAEILHHDIFPRKHASEDWISYP